MTDPHEAEGLASAQEDDYAYRGFHEYKWDLDKDFLVGQHTHPPPTLQTHRDQHPSDHDNRVASCSP